MRKLVLFLILSIPFLFPPITYAHAFGQLYALPIPVWLYIYGGGITLVISFVVIGIFVNEKKSKNTQKTIDISSTYLVRCVTSNFFQVMVKLIFLAIWVIVLTAGFIGDQTPTNNLMPLFFWIFLLLGGIYMSAFLGNVWKTIGPIRIVFTFLRRTFHISPLFSFKKNTYIPALIVYYVLVWMELLSRGWAVVPHILSSIVLVYLLTQVVLALLLGEKWLEHGELFEVLFSFLGNMSSIYVENKKIKVRMPFSGLTTTTLHETSAVVFILFMLSSTAFDGIRSTIVWRPVQYALYPLFSFVSKDPFVIFPIIQSLALLVSPFLFLFLYMLCIYVMKKIIRTNLSVKDLFLVFAISLLPIALAYNIAHYFTLLMSGFGPLWNLVSDPFHMGWNLLHTSMATTSTQIFRVTTIWNVEVAAIVGGHIVAVYVAHIIALKIFPTHKQALKSQIPMLLLMVLYTITGLWILSQPLTIGF